MIFEPACMTPDELALWHDANDALVRVGRAKTDRPCRDCPLAFAADMRLQGCCNGEPLSTGRPRQPADPVRDRRRLQWREATRRATMRKRLARPSVAA